jgi:hypothetical protein
LLGSRGGHKRRCRIGSLARKGCIGSGSAQWRRCSAALRLTLAAAQLSAVAGFAVLALTLAGELGLAWYVLDAGCAGFAFNSHKLFCLADAVRQGRWGGLAVGVEHQPFGNAAVGAVKLAV